MATKTQVLSAARKLEQKHGITIEVTTRQANTLADMYEVELYIVQDGWQFNANESGSAYAQHESLRECYDLALDDLRAGVAPTP
jgi:ABC-type cobalamin/Fe3+-siderophores transport system ATPase subunit